jgi:hypothetical protein
MNKTALILAGALAFDLGAFVAGGQAAETPGGPTPIPVPAPSCIGRCSNGEHIRTLALIKLDALTTPQVCVQKGGKVVDVKGIPMCKLPAPTTSDR